MNPCNTNIIKYPRTRHVEGSNLQPGDEDLSQVPFSELKEKFLVVEEKVDGSNTAISFSKNGELLLQCRGHYLNGKGDKAHFDMFKSFAYQIHHLLQPILEYRYIMYGEWLFAKHTMFYDKLNSYFQEFDIYDRQEMVFLSTEERNRLLHPVRPHVESVLVLESKKFHQLEDLVNLVGKSAFISDDYDARYENLIKACEVGKSKFDLEVERTDLSGLMEGIYIKHEEDGIVKNRYKWVRRDFLQSVLESGTHWNSRFIVKNRLKVR